MKFGSQLKDALKALGLGAPKKPDPSEAPRSAGRPGPLSPNANPSRPSSVKPAVHSRHEVPQVRRASPAPIDRMQGKDAILRISAHRGRHFRLIVDGISA